MTDQELEKHFKGYKLHHFLMYFPLGFLAMHGILSKDPIVTICAITTLIGGVLQGKFFFAGIKKMIKFIQEDLLNNRQ